MEYTPVQRRFKEVFDYMEYLPFAIDLGIFFCPQPWTFWRFLCLLWIPTWSLNICVWVSAHIWVNVCLPVTILVHMSMLESTFKATYMTRNVVDFKSAFVRTWHPVAFGYIVTVWQERQKGELGVWTTNKVQVTGTTQCWIFCILNRKLVGEWGFVRVVSIREPPSNC